MRIASIWIAQVACVAVLHCGSANAQDRGPSAQERRAQAAASEARERERAADPEVVAAKLAELEAFLRNLMGRFRYEGEVKLHYAFTTDSNFISQGCDGTGSCKVTEGAQGIADCIGFGNGPGVQCVTHVPWPRFFRPMLDKAEVQWGGPFLDGAMSLYGIDPDQPGIRFLLVDSQSIAFTELGELKGNTLTFETECPWLKSQILAGVCLRTFRIRALPDGRLEMHYEVGFGPVHLAEYRFSLHREPVPQLEEASK